MKKKELLINILISLCLIVILFLLNNLYPLGKEYVVGDSSLYYILWNILHGNESILFSFNTYLELFSTLVSDGIILPLNILIGLVSQNNILNMLSYIFIIRFIICYFSTYLLLSKLFKDKKLIYFILILYLVFGFYLVGIKYILICSLLLLGLYYLLEKKNGLLFSLSLSLLMILLFKNWWIGLVLILFVSSLLVIYKKYNLINILYIFIFSLLGFGISSIVLVTSLDLYKDKIINDNVYSNNDSIKNTLVYNDMFSNDGYKYVNRYGLDSNYSYLLNIPSIENGSIYMNEDDLVLKDSLGFGGTNKYISSYGGTLLTDLVLGNKYFITSNELDSRLYKLLDNKNDLYYYESIYNLDYLISYNGNIFNDDNGSFIDNNNSIYKVLFNMEDDLVHRVDVSNINNNYSFKIKKDKEYYVYVTPEAYEDVNIYFDNKDININSIYFNNNDGFITYKIVFDCIKDSNIIMPYSDYKIESIEVGYIDINEYIDFVSNIDHLDVKYINNINSIEYKYNSDNNGYVLLPIKYNDRYNISINNKDINYSKNIYDLVSIKVNKGINNIKISYKYKYCLLLSIISIVSFIILIVLVIFRKKIK